MQLYTNLTQVDGETKLKKMILDKMNAIIVGPYLIITKGVKEVLLPDSFSVH